MIDWDGSGFRNPFPPCQRAWANHRAGCPQNNSLISKRIHTVSLVFQPCKVNYLICRSRQEGTRTMVCRSLQRSFVPYPTKGNSSGIRAFSMIAPQASWTRPNSNGYINSFSYLVTLANSQTMPSMHSMRTKVG